jgi:phenylpyruvate tautomerase PptA (4-oxalocrotonate tautomerase family)
MPLTHISMRVGKPEAYRRAILDGVARALHETFDVPEDNEFMAITEHDQTNFRYDPSYLGVERATMSSSFRSSQTILGPWSRKRRFLPG